MVVINYNTREVSCKIVFYGPGLSGKTTNLQYIHSKVPSKTKGDLISLATDADRTLYFDFLPINIGDINGFTTKFQLYTVPGQVFYNATRKLVLRGVDGIVFVADSQRAKADENVESLNNLKENLEEHGIDLSTLPFVMQYNKRDLPDVMSIQELDELMNENKWCVFEACASSGKGVFDTLKYVIKLVLDRAKKEPETQDAAQKVEDANLASVEPLPAAESQEKYHAEIKKTSETTADRQSAQVVGPVVSEPSPVRTDEYRTAAVSEPHGIDQPVATPPSAADVSNEPEKSMEPSSVVTATEQEISAPQQDIHQRTTVVAEEQLEDEIETEQVESNPAVTESLAGTPEPHPVGGNELYKRLPNISHREESADDPEDIDPKERSVFSVPTMRESLRAKKKKKGFFLFRWLFGKR